MGCFYYLWLFPRTRKISFFTSHDNKNQNGEDQRNDLLDKYKTVVTDRKSNYIGYFASFTYGFDERYILTASFRSDASNRFGQDTRNRFLPDGLLEDVGCTL